MNEGNQNLTISNQFISVLDGSFLSCKSLLRVTFEGQNVSIGSSAFKSCTNLQNVTIKGDQITIEKKHFILALY